jgi:hypothetical protein
MLEHARRMYRDALQRVNDADILAGSSQTQSDSPALLRILGFEVLLKCALRLSGKTSPQSHDYAALWRQLPSDAQDEILATACTRMPGHADLSDMERLLTTFEFIFKRVRYYYELYEGYTLNQEHELGRRWIEKGAPRSMRLASGTTPTSWIA